MTGQTGLVSMPDARLAPDGTWRMGMSFLRPYQALWTSVTVLPWLEASGRYTRIMHVPGFDRPGTDFGDFKDKSFDFKVRLFDESGSRPSAALGIQDAHGTQVFRASYAALSKRIGEFDATLGYGRGRIDGLFGGLRWQPQRLPQWSFVAEYDAFDYPRDRGAQLSGAASYRKGPAFGVEYRWGWLGAQVAASHGQLAFNVHLAVPMHQREFVPKTREPEPWLAFVPRPTEEQWASDVGHRARLRRALLEHDFRRVHFRYENGRLEATLANARISSMPRAVGRAARILLAFAPLETREIRITYLAGLLPAATYTFVHLPVLQRYFAGTATPAEFAQYVSVAYAQPGGGDEATDRAEALAGFAEPLAEAVLRSRPEGDLVAFAFEDDQGNRFRLRPGVQTFLNDPSGAFKYDVSLYANFDRVLPGRVALSAEAKWTLLETVSDVTQPSNSLLPHVRSDVALYRREARLKVTRLLANKYFHPLERVYARLSAGIYEEMFSGIGGQILYLPRAGGWAADLQADWLRQRDYRGLFGHRDYSVFTAIGSLHYRLAHGVTLTARAGRFLAGDEGVRFEAKRRFRSGIEVGAWYSFTNAKDITSPGSPGNPYRDKGVFLTMPLHILLEQDTGARAGFALSPWTRDVGQMVASPGDLYRILENPLTVGMVERGGLARMGDYDDEYYDLPKLGSGGRDRRWPEAVLEDLWAAGSAARHVHWLSSAAIGAGAILASSAFDRRALRYAEEHEASRLRRSFVRATDALPLAALGAAAIAAFDESRPRLSDCGWAALEAGALAFAGSELLKRAIGRARPEMGLGPRNFDTFTSRESRASFPSRHTALAWAALTPFAREYDADWLYGVALLSNVGRAMSTRHWLSDTVAGALLGYAAGYLAWEGRRAANRAKNAPDVLVGPRSVSLAWQLD
ncbi:MAG: YjbH domain-containing protein [Burkholderiales bacterium]|nr:YjbH domain-containing protein [Burkholderiales bacterium]